MNIPNESYFCAWFLPQNVSYGSSFHIFFHSAINFQFLSFYSKQFFLLLLLLLLKLKISHRNLLLPQLLTASTQFINERDSRVFHCCCFLNIRSIACGHSPLVKLIGKFLSFSFRFHFMPAQPYANKQLQNSGPLQYNVVYFKSKLRSIYEQFVPYYQLS